jgi:phenylacetate-coenzyme A ligase PaaK-like adenylate-forming protein
MYTGSNLLTEDQALKRQMLHRTIGRAVEESPLYREKYGGFDLQGQFDRVPGILPLLSREEYYRGMKPPGFPLLSGGLQDCYIFTSGGTTGDVKLTAWSRDYVKNWTRECYRSLTAAGLEAGDVVVNLFFPGIWATHTLINKSLEMANCRIVPLGGKVSLETLVTYLKRFAVTVLIGVPSFIVRAVEYIDSLPVSKRSGIGIKKIFHAGEFLPQRQAEYIEERLGCSVTPFLYSSTDTGTIGMKCPFCKTNQYHLADTMYLEVLDEETAEQVPPGKAGEFVVTSLVNSKAPCIRYRVGDRGIIDEGECKCGSRAPLFTLLGRADDEVKVAGYLISPEIVMQGLEQFPQLSRNFQLIVEEEGRKARLTVACETLPGVPETEKAGLAEQISQSLVDHYDILGVLVEQGYCLPPYVRLLSPGSVPRNPATGKIKRVRDLR